MLIFYTYRLKIQNSISHIDNLTPEQRSKTMAAIKSSGTKIEQEFIEALLQRKIRSLEFHVDELPGKPDVVHRKAKIAIFLDGCFWHGCPEHYNIPETNREYWKTKIKRNKRRDRQNNNELKKAGWLVLRIWGHSIKKERSRKWWLTRIENLVRKRLQKN
ncbi:hypothetical protein BH23BAC3_BH23BAC3_02360 [soil metagenome]